MNNFGMPRQLFGGPGRYDQGRGNQPDRDNCSGRESQRHWNTQSFAHSIKISNPGALENGTQHLFCFEELAGDFAGGEGVPGVVGIDLSDALRDFA